MTDTGTQEVISNLIEKLVKEKKEPDLDLKIYNEEMALDKIIPFQKKNYNWTTTNKTYILQYNYKKTRRAWILQLYDSLRKIWFFMGGKWPWISLFC